MKNLPTSSRRNSVGTHTELKAAFIGLCIISMRPNKSIFQIYHADLFYLSFVGNVVEI